jgi:hypothetical protein
LRLALATVVLTVVAGLAFATPSSAFVKAFWGPTKVRGASQFYVYKDLGVKVFQTYLRWYDVARNKRPAHPRDPNDPAYHWPSDVSYAISQAKKNGMRVALMIITTPAWASGHASGEWVPKNPKDFGDFAYAASKKYPSVKEWMAWGEPSRVPNFKPQTPENGGQPLTSKQKVAPHNYARMLDAMYGALKQRSSSNLVIGGNTFSGGDIRPVRWVENMRLPNGKPPRLDLYGQNPFTPRKPDLKNGPYCEACADFSDLKRFNKTLDKNLGWSKHPHIQIFISEWTIPTEPGDREFGWYVSPARQADWIKAAFKVAHQINAYGFGWIHLWDEYATATQGAIHSGLIFADSTRKPGYFAFKDAR